MTAPDPAVPGDFTPSRETYPKLHANTFGSTHQGQTSTEAQAALDEIDRLRDDVAKLLTRCLLLDEEVAHQRKVIHAAARDLYVAEIHRQGVGWDDYCTDLLVRSQHALAAETKP